MHILDLLSVFCLILYFLFVFSTDITDRNELKAFFETNCSQIYFIFYENFITLESNLKQKGKICLYAFRSLDFFFKCRQFYHKNLSF